MAVVKTDDILKQFTASLSSQSFTSVSKVFEKTPGDSETKRILLDQSFREYLTQQLVTPGKTVELDKCDALVELSIAGAKDSLCSTTLPILLLSDVFDVITLDQCETLFTSVERNVSTWKGEPFFNAVKNNLLRICNDLLRRLSRTQNTVFCGRILLFLAKFFPFSERSGLNVVSEFNLENTTVFSTGDAAAATNGDKESLMDVDEDVVNNAIKIEEDQNNLNVDYALYSKFWQLQDFFRNPTQCYSNIKWRTFSSFSADVLGTFQSFKLDSISGKRRKTVAEEEDQFFAKYLTNQNLLQLQLSDSNFRRYILIQFLILFQYLQSSVKFKQETQVLTDDQNKWIESTRTRVFGLLAETPPNGSQFAESVKHILLREEQWNAWKNEGCPSLAKIAPKDTASNGNAKSAVRSTRKRKRKLGDQIQEAMQGNTFLMGNVALTKLWNLCPDNLEACSAPERDFLPQMDDYFAEAIEQLDPSSQIEDQYKKVYDGQWGWRALRLLAKKSPHFFTYGNHPIAKLPEYLDTMLKKMSNNLTANISSSPSSNGATTNGAATKGTESGKVGLHCTEEQLKKLADNIGDQWRKVLPKLGLDTKVNQQFEAAETDEKKQALLMLEKWVAEEGEAATKEDLVYILEGLKMDSVVEGVFEQ